MRKYSVREGKFPFHIRETVNAVLFPSFVSYILQLGWQAKHEKTIKHQTLAETTSQHIKLTPYLRHYSYTTITFSLSI